MVVSSAQGSARDFSTWGGGFLEDGGRDGLETGQRQRDPSMGGWDIKWLGWVGGRDILGEMVEDNDGGKGDRDRLRRITIIGVLSIWC